MKCAPLAVIIYGVLLFVGGIFGYVKAQSMVSLAMGSISAALILAGGAAMFKGGTIGWVGYWFTLTVTALLTALFGYRFFHTQKFFPSGLLAIVSIAILFILLIQTGMWKKQQ
jgi:uncharacterized membrane protein (UPF0136 family)